MVDSSGVWDLTPQSDTPASPPSGIPQNQPSRWEEKQEEEKEKDVVRREGPAMMSEPKLPAPLPLQAHCCDQGNDNDLNSVRAHHVPTSRQMTNECHLCSPNVHTLLGRRSWWSGEGHLYLFDQVLEISD